MNKNGHVEFALLLLATVIIAWTVAIMSGSVFGMIVAGLFTAMACTHPYFLTAIFTPIVMIGYCIEGIFKKIKSKLER